MQIAAETTTPQSLLSSTASEFSGSFRRALYFRPRAIRRNGAIVAFKTLNISVAAMNEVPEADYGQHVIDNRFSKRSTCGAGYLAMGRAPIDLNNGVRLDAAILYRDLLARRSGDGFGSTGLAPGAE